MYLNEELFIDFLNVREILWVGINFEKAKFTRNGFNYSKEIMQLYFHEWNMLILNDQKKYDVRMSFRKPIMQYDLSTITKINKSLKTSNLITDHIDIKDVYSDEQICNYISKIKFPKSLPFALNFTVESFDATTKTASIWVIITHTETNKVVLCEKFLKTPSGFGTKNYWARTFYNVFYDIQSSAFIRWENMIQNKLNDSKAKSQSL